MILIAGATGSNGAELVKLLSMRGVSVRAMVRSREGAAAIAELPGVELVIGKQATGKPARSFGQFAQDYASMFS
jgi:uncharacterized protein YbjT (DUF2867 family)